MKRFALVGITLLLSGCGSAPDEAVVSLILDSPPHPYLSSCLTILGKDPRPELLAKLRSAKRNVVAGSNCTKGRYDGIYINGQRAEQIVINKFHRVVPWRVKVEYSTYMGGLGGSGWTAQLERINGVWVVRSSDMQWISFEPNNSSKSSPQSYGVDRVASLGGLP